MVRGYFVNVMMEGEERQSRRDPISMAQGLDNANLGKSLKTRGQSVTTSRIVTIIQCSLSNGLLT